MLHIVQHDAQNLFKFRRCKTWSTMYQGISATHAIATYLFSWRNKLCLKLLKIMSTLEVQSAGWKGLLHYVIE
jgi:hypothetical protein